MSKTKRIDIILKILDKNQTINVNEMAKNLKVTPETIRRDLKFLEEENKLKRVYGGAVKTWHNVTEYDFKKRSVLFTREKKQIAIKAAQLVEEKDFIALDDSTTNIEIAKVLSENFKNISILTNSLVIAEIFGESSNTRVLLAGGRINNKEKFTYGTSAIEFVNKFNTDIFFMSASGVDLKYGVTDYGIDQLDVKLAMKKNSQSIYVVADYSKLFVRAKLKVCRLDEVDKVITNDEIDNKSLMEFKKKDVDII